MNIKDVTSEVRLQKWLPIISERNQSGLSIHEFCSQRSLSENAYYYWLKKARTQVLEQSSPDLVEIPVKLDQTVIKEAALTVSIGKAVITVNSSVSRELFSMVSEVLLHAE